MFWRPVEVAQIKTTNSLRVVVAQRKKNSIVPEGKAINAYGWNFSLLSSSYQPQCRYASHMCLLENAQHERIFKVDLREQSRASIVLFIAIVLFSRIKSFPRNLCLRSSKNSSSVLKLETWSSKLDSRNALVPIYTPGIVHAKELGIVKMWHSLAWLIPANFFGFLKGLGV